MRSEGGGKSGEGGAKYFFGADPLGSPWMCLLL